MPAKPEGEYRRVKVGDKWVRFPMSMSKEEVGAAIQKNKTAQDEPGMAETAARSAVGGATLGFDDEIEGFMLSGANKLGGEGFSGFTGREGAPDTSSYEEMRDWLREQNKRGADAHPATALIGEFVGSMVTGGAGLAKFAGGKAIKHALPSLIGGGAGMGALAGAGYSEGETLEEIDRDAAIGGGLGAVLGVAGPSVGAGVGKLVGKFNPFRAQRTVKKDMKQSGLDEQAVEQELAANPNMVAADLSDQLGERMGAAANANPAVAREAREFTGKRQEGARDRLGAVLGGGLGNQSTREAVDTLKTETAKAAKPLYDAAYVTPITPTPEMLRAALQTPAGKSATKDALTAFQNKTDLDPADIPFERTATGDFKRSKQGVPFPDTSSTRYWDEVQRALGDSKQALSTSGITAKSRDYGRLQDAVNDGAEAQNPAFKAARSLWRGGKDDEDALEMGQKAFTSIVPNVKDDFAKMSTSSKGMFKLGVFEKIDDILAKKGSGDSLETVFKDKKKRDIISLALDNPDLEKAFFKALGDEAAMERTWRAVRNASLIDTHRVVQTMPAMTFGMAAYQGARKSLTEMILDPVERGKASNIGGALLGRNPFASQQVPQKMGKALAATGGVAATDPTSWRDMLLPSASPPLPR